MNKYLNYFFVIDNKLAGKEYLVKFLIHITSLNTNLWQFLDNSTTIVSRRQQ